MQTSSSLDWPQWRGPRRDAHVAGFKVPARWPAQLTKKWSLTVGEGHASPIIVGNRAFVIVRQGNDEHVLCLDMASGKTLWKDVVTAPFDSVIFPATRLGKAPRSTPLWHQGKLYTIGVNGLMTCFDATKGAIVWRKDFSKQFPIPMPVCGASLSPLIDGKKLYVHAGHEATGAFLALDKDTGKELWAWKGEGPGYTSPQLVTIGGVKQLITASHNLWLGLSPEDGKQLWSLANRQNMFNHNSITPVISNDTVLCGANQRATFALKLTQSAGKWSTAKVWESRDVTMSTSSPVLDGKRVYVVNEKRRGQLAVMDFATGKITWECPGNKGEQVTLFDVGPVLLVSAQGGEVFAYQKSGDTLKEIAKYEVADSAMWASPAISGNRLLVKGASSLALWEIPA